MSADLTGLTWREGEPADAAAIVRGLDEWWEQRLEHCVRPQLLEHFDPDCASDRACAQ